MSLGHCGSKWRKRSRFHWKYYPHTKYFSAGKSVFLTHRLFHFTLLWQNKRDIFSVFSTTVIKLPIEIRNEDDSGNHEMIQIFTLLKWLTLNCGYILTKKVSFQIFIFTHGSPLFCGDLRIHISLSRNNAPPARIHGNGPNFVISMRVLNIMLFQFLDIITASI